MGEDESEVTTSSPNRVPNTWGALLFTNASHLGLNLFVCPTYKPKRFADWFRTYGARSDPPNEYYRGVISGVEVLGFLKTETVERPSDYLHLADTTSLAVGGFTEEQLHYFRADTTNVLARHSKMVNGWFLDGHSEACGRKRMDSLGIPSLFYDSVRGYYW